MEVMFRMVMIIAFVISTSVFAGSNSTRQDLDQKIDRLTERREKIEARHQRQLNAYNEHCSSETVTSKRCHKLQKKLAKTTRESNKISRKIARKQQQADKI